MGELSSASVIGFTVPSPAYLIGAMAFGIIDFVSARPNFVSRRGATTPNKILHYQEMEWQ